MPDKWRRLKFAERQFEGATLARVVLLTEVHFAFATPPRQTSSGAFCETR
jgi:hypothetical protein